MPPTAISSAWWWRSWAPRWRAPAPTIWSAAALIRWPSDLLDVTRITRNKLQLHTERLELNEVVLRAVDDNRSFFEQAGVRVDIGLAVERLFIVADRTRLRQILGNVLNNAAKFTSRGGLTRVGVHGEGGEAVVSVADDGVGMSQESVAHLFQPFIQAEQTLDRSHGGLGLGLALVKRLVELHGGTVSARSEGLGCGMEVILRLPLDTRIEPMAELDRSSHEPAERHRILLIEDNADAAELLRDALQLRGHQVAIAYNGADGLQEARSFQPEVVLCDIGLPGMSGYDVARAFRADDALRHTCLVALTGYALPEDIRRATDAGFEQHVAKPPTLDKLEQVLSSARRSTPGH